MKDMYSETNAPSAAERKLVKSLGDAKWRRETGLFVAEGAKCVLDTLGVFELKYLFATQDFVRANASRLAGYPTRIMSVADAGRMTHFSTPSPVMAVYRIPERKLDISRVSGSLVLALDRIQDPGNLGTLVRVCDWFGITDILAGEGTVSVWNPKTVQATMGAIARVKVYETNLCETLARWPKDAPVGGTFLDGESLYEAKLPAKGVIVMGNEGQGISPEVADLCSLRLTIPSFPAGRITSESLNVAMAAAVTVSEWRRRLL